MSAFRRRLAKLEAASRIVDRAPLVTVADGETDAEAIAHHVAQTGYRGPFVVGGPVMTEAAWEAKYGEGGTETWEGKH